MRYGGTALAGREQAAGLGVAIVPQGNGLASSLTAAENVLVPLLSTGLRGPPTRSRRTDEALARVGLEESGSHLIEELSGGQQQRVALARGPRRRGPTSCWRTSPPATSTPPTASGSWPRCGPRRRAAPSS